MMYFTQMIVLYYKATYLFFSLPKFAVSSLLLSPTSPEQNAISWPKVAGARVAHSRSNKALVESFVRRFVSTPPALLPVTNCDGISDQMKYARAVDDCFHAEPYSWSHFGVRRGPATLNLS